MSRVYIGIGSNLGSRRGNCETAVKMAGRIKGVTVKDVSGFYETLPVGGPPQPSYINGVILIDTVLSADELLVSLKEIEKKMGRESSPGRDLPRIIDLDILFYDDIVMSSPDLVIPHAKMHERSFVLKGLMEIAPEVVHPVLGKTVKDMFRELPD